MQLTNKNYVLSVLLAYVMSSSSQLMAAPINTVDYFSLSTTEIIDFESISTPGGFAYFDGVLNLSGASFAERFVGQTLSFSGVSDVLGGSSSSSLALQTGSTGENILIAEVGPNKGIAGLGVGGLNGEGSLAILFDTAQSEFGIIALGGDSGPAYFDFWASDGTLIDTFSTSGLGPINYFGFSREGGVQDIAGVSIWNTDPGGVGFDDIVFGAKNTAVPLPGALVLFLAGLLGLFGFTSKKVSY